MANAGTNLTIPSGPTFHATRELRTSSRCVFKSGSVKLVSGSWFGILGIPLSWRIAQCTGPALPCSSWRCCSSRSDHKAFQMFRWAVLRFLEIRTAIIHGMMMMMFEWWLVYIAIWWSRLILTKKEGLASILRHGFWGELPAELHGGAVEDHTVFYHYRSFCRWCLYPRSFAWATRMIAILNNSFLTFGVCGLVYGAVEWAVLAIHFPHWIWMILDDVCGFPV